MQEYSQFAAALQRIDADNNVAELHGQMAGLMCARQDVDFSYWMTEAMPALPVAQASGDALANESAAVLDNVFKQTHTSLSDGQLGFQLLLPDDESPLVERIAALAEWCQGYLVGLAMAGIKDLQNLPGELPDLMNDLLEISRAEGYQLGDEQEDEQAYIDLVEYVRLGVMMVWDEIQQLYAKREGQDKLH